MQNMGCLVVIRHIIPVKWLGYRSSRGRRHDDGTSRTPSEISGDSGDLSLLHIGMLRLDS